MVHPLQRVLSPSIKSGLVNRDQSLHFPVDWFFDALDPAVATHRIEVERYIHSRFLHGGEQVVELVEFGGIDHG